MKRTSKVKYSIAASIAFLTFLVYLPVLRNDFVGWDDGTYVVNNPFVHALNETLLMRAFLNFYAGNWHPLTWISHALDYAVWGLNPLGHHLTNNLLHAINTFWVVLLVVTLIEAIRGRQPLSSQVVGLSRTDSTTQQFNSSTSAFMVRDSHFTFIPACMTGLLFGLHPIHVESVAWVAERKDLLCALFFLLSTMAYTEYAWTVITPSSSSYLERGWQSRGHYLLSLFFFILALLSKPMAVSLPAVLLILDWYPFGRIASLKTFRTSLVEKIPFFALGLASSVITILAQKAGGAMSMMEFVPLTTRTLVAAKSLISYLVKMMFPMNLLPLYPYPGNVSFLSLEFLAPVILITGTTAACGAILKREKLWLAIWLYYIVTLIPVLGIIQVGAQPMADRYTYLPCLGPFLAAGLLSAWIYRRIWTARKRALFLRIGSIAAAAAVFVSLSYVTLKQISVWRNGITLWSYVIEKEPLKVPRAYNNGGLALMERGRIDEALDYFHTAVRLDPANASAFNNLGLAYKTKGMFDEAIEQFQKALSISPDDPEVHNNLGVAYKYKGLYEKAKEQCQIALSLKPDYAEAHFNLGSIYLETGALDKAKEEFEAGLKMRPDDQKARRVLNEIISR